MKNEPSLRTGTSEGTSRGRKAVFWISTSLFAAMMTMSGVMYLTQPTMVETFQHLGFPAYFRVELAIAKLFGVLALLAPFPARVKEWAYAGFGITLISAVVAHANVDGPAEIVPPLVAAVLLTVSYLTRSRTAVA
jgi:uncharacterized membrane protein YphA (DoxX/SURF4 family)